MSDELKQIDSKLTTLERDVVAEYRVLKETADESGDRFVRVPDALIRRFGRVLQALKEALFGTGNTKSLRLVCDYHDALRIRMLYIENLLDRTIPHVYLTQALKEFPEYRTVETAPERVSSRPVWPEPEERAPGPLKRLLLGLLALLRGPGGRSRSESSTGGGARSTEPVSRQRSDPALSARENELRLIYLYKLMEEDYQNLIDAAERPPRIAEQIELPPFIANFTAKDFAETHFGVRTGTAGERIARTPEELRAKLAQRQSSS